MLSLILRHETQPRSRFLFLQPVGLAGVLWLILAASGCNPRERGSEAGRPEGQVLPDPSRFRVVDLSYPYDDETLYWPTSPSRFELTRLSYGPSSKGYFYSANAFCAPEHGGTHLDAPIHFAEGGRAVDEIPLEQLVAPGVLIDASEPASRDPDYRLTREDVLAWEQKHGKIPSGAIVLLRTGWGRFWPDAKQYLGDDKPGDASNLHFPSYGVEAARLLVEERRVGAVGVDTASIDYGPSEDFMVHRVAGRAHVPALENLANIDQLPSSGYWIIALPLKIRGGSGGPARILALLPK